MGLPSTSKYMLVKMNLGANLGGDVFARGTQNSCRVRENNAQTGDDTFCGAQFGSTLAGRIEDL